MMAKLKIYYLTFCIYVRSLTAVSLPTGIGRLLLLNKKDDSETMPLAFTASLSPTNQIYKEFEISSDKYGWAINFQQLSFNEHTNFCFCAAQNYLSLGTAEYLNSTEIHRMFLSSSF